MKTPPSIIVQLIHIHGPMKGEIGEFSQESISIGRNQTCTIRFPADLTVISRNHAEIRRDGNRFQLIDSSRNGTYVNGKKITEYILRDGDVIELADGGPKLSFLTRVVEKEDQSAVEEACAPVSAEIPEHETEPVKKELAEVEAPPEFQQQQKQDVPPPSVQPVIEPPSSEAFAKVSVPLVIQFGPTIHTFRELPIFIGRISQCEFVIDHPRILDRHARLFFDRSKYWIQDLTGKKMIQVNDHPIDMQHALSQNDIFSLTSEGPVFTFIGDGRIMEVTGSDEDPVDVKDGSEAKPATGETAGFWSRLKKKF